MIGMKDLGKLAAITVVTLCAAFVCTIFLNYKMDLPAIREIITAYQEIVFYEAQMGTCLLYTSTYWNDQTVVLRMEI